MADLSIFGVVFENTIAIFEISVLEFVFLQSLVQKHKSGKRILWKIQKFLNIPPKMPYLGIFG